MPAPRLCIRSIRKSFGATRALDGVSFEVAPGEVHTLIGENGAGKSTLVKILSGAHQPDAGGIELDGRAFSPRNPQHARRHGIAMIYQELNLAPDLSVEENILLGEEPSRFGWINRRERRRLALGPLEELDRTAIPLGKPVGLLPLAEQQIVEIARALVGKPRVLIMDEPTSSLSRIDTEKLFAAIKRLKQSGVSVIYISHFLEECRRICDRYTVMRDGRSVGGGEMEGAALPDIIRMMVGRDVQDIYPRITHTLGESVMELDDLTGMEKPTRASLRLRRGEILGIAGLIGAGRTEMLRAVFGLDRVRSGRVFVGAHDSTGGSPARHLREGVGLLSENRKEEGLLLNRSLADNTTLTRFGPLSRFGFISNRRQREATRGIIKQLDVKTSGPDQTISELSGGNQQKIALGRLIHHDADILLLDEPTRGIDVGSKAQIYLLIEQLAARGKAILFVSSYLPELLGVCDTIGVMCRGTLSDLRPAGEWTEHSIISAAVGRTEPD